MWAGHVTIPSNWSIPVCFPARLEDGVRAGGPLHSTLSVFLCQTLLQCVHSLFFSIFWLCTVLAARPIIPTITAALDQLRSLQSGRYWYPFSFVLPVSFEL
jgi:hypothetical protein